MSTVLIIDDEWSIREVTTLMLERAGYKALSAASAAEGLAVLAENDVSLVIIDVVLPERNGLDLALEVHQKKPKIPIVLMSGRISTEADSIQNFTGHFGIACSIAKPFTQAQLVQVIKSTLASSC
ncbi:MAG: response regulator [Clostridia bacterium]|jgi:DNA-binding NtrC family response regulator|nr:response regulator [Spirochaetia bacterium]